MKTAQAVNTHLAEALTANVLEIFRLLFVGILICLIFVKASASPIFLAYTTRGSYDEHFTGRTFC
jgi:hypothetical protein